MINKLNQELLKQRLRVLDSLASGKVKSPNAGVLLFWLAWVTVVVLVLVK